MQVNSLGRALSAYSLDSGGDPAVMLQAVRLMSSAELRGILSASATTAQYRVGQLSGTQDLKAQLRGLKTVNVDGGYLQLGDTSAQGQDLLARIHAAGESLPTGLLAPVSATEYDAAGSLTGTIPRVTIAPSNVELLRSLPKVSGPDAQGVEVFQDDMAAGGYRLWELYNADALIVARPADVDALIARLDAQAGAAVVPTGLAIGELQNLTGRMLEELSAAQKDAREVRREQDRHDAGIHAQRLDGAHQRSESASLEMKRQFDEDRGIGGGRPRDRF